mgnify:CR=1 FL=1
MIFGRLVKQRARPTPITEVNATSVRRSEEKALERLPSARRIDPMPAARLGPILSATRPPNPARAARKASGIENTRPVSVKFRFRLSLINDMMGEMFRKAVYIENPSSQVLTSTRYCDLLNITGFL